MKHRIVVLLALGSASACALFFSACGGSDNTNVDGGGNDATTNDVATNDTGTNDTGTTDTGAKDGGGGGDAACTSGPGCRQCCAALYPDATAAFATLEETCACTTPGDCKTACGNSLCQGKQPSGGCQACLFNKDAGDCFTTAATSCLADPSCKPLAECVASCGTAPQDAGGGG